jgi:hypothetical protein
MELILGIVLLSTVGGIVKAAITRGGRRQSVGERDAFKRMEEAFLQMQDEIAGLRQDVGELQERVDFAERVLTRGRESNEGQ